MTKKKKSTDKGTRAAMAERQRAVTENEVAKMTRDFMKERQTELQQDELARLLKRVFHPDTEYGREILKTYRQNPLLEVLLRNLDRDK